MLQRLEQGLAEYTRAISSAPSPDFQSVAMRPTETPVPAMRGRLPQISGLLTISVPILIIVAVIVLGFLLFDHYTNACIEYLT